MSTFDRLVRRVMYTSREKAFSRFVSCMAPQRDDVILDLGAAGDYYQAQHIFEDYYSYKDNIIGVNININELTVLKRKYRNILLVLADGCSLPFKSKSIDILFSNAVIEHIGDMEKQKQFADEIMRVAKKWFVTTPNFWFPIEVHWRLPFIHFLPRKWQREIMVSGRNLFVESSPKLPRIMKRPLAVYFSKHGWWRDGLHLLSARNLKKLFPPSKIEKQRTTFYPEVLIAYFAAIHETKSRVSKKEEMSLVPCENEKSLCENTKNECMLYTNFVYCQRCFPRRKG